MKIQSLDPRVNRMDFADDEAPKAMIDVHGHGPTFEVFVHNRRGEQHKHAGIVHAANNEIALVLAKEQFARRGRCANLWVVNSNQITATDYNDSDIFDSLPEKTHREAIDYKVKDKINQFLKSKK